MLVLGLAAILYQPFVSSEVETRRPGFSTALEANGWGPMADSPRARSALAASVEGLPIGELAPQALPASGCAAYLFTTGAKRHFVAMASPGALRLALDGATLDLPRADERGAAGYGLSADTDYRSGDTAAALSLTVAERADLRDGAVVPAATLRIDRPGKDGVVVPLVGLIGCTS